MKRALVVETYPALAQVLAIALGREGHEVVRVDRVARALEVEGPFDGAIIEAELLDGSGVELAEQLIADERVRWVVFYTACRTPETLERAARLGPIVDKMLGVETLMTALRSVTDSAKVANGDEASEATSRSGTRRRVR